MNPLVSYIIPCYNQGDFLNSTLDSVEQEGYKEYEIIVIDDGSEDVNTIQVLQSIEKRNKLKVLRTTNSGPAVARNQGIRSAKGKYLVFLDGDDLIEKGFIEKAILYLEKSSETPAVYGNITFFGERSEKRIQAPVNPAQLCMYNSVTICSVARKAIIDELNGFDEYLSRLGREDWELWLRLTSLGKPPVYIGGDSFRVRVREGSRSQKTKTNLETLQHYVRSKHSAFIMQQFELLYHDNRALRKSFKYWFREKIKSLTGL
jgi:glycosyltransferase involved in cell wall biosynthesis